MHIKIICGIFFKNSYVALPTPVGGGIEEGMEDICIF